MRMVTWGAAAVGAAALTLASAPAAALAPASPVSTAPLAAGEVLLEVNAFGMSTDRADAATMRLTLLSQGDTEAEARRAHAALVRRLTEAARAGGVQAADIHVGETQVEESYAVPDLSMDVDMSDPSDVDLSTVTVATPDEPSGADEANDREPPRPRKAVRATMELRLRDVDRAPALRESLQEAGAQFVMPTQYRLDDDRPARRAARAQAIANARADADAYAAALGMRVVRIVRVTERIGLDLIGLAISETSELERLFTSMYGSGRQGQVQTFVTVGVDFALTAQ